MRKGLAVSKPGRLRSLPTSEDQELYSVAQEWAQELDSVAIGRIPSGTSQVWPLKSSCDASQAGQGEPCPRWPFGSLSRYSWEVGGSASQFLPGKSPEPGQRSSGDSQSSTAVTPQLGAQMCPWGPRPSHRLPSHPIPEVRP